MCRLLLVKSVEKFEIGPHLLKFAQIAKNSKEYQGHGWGCAYIEENKWKYYKNIQPIWKDNLNKFPTTTQLLAHARSAFENEGITIENNMPFYDENYVFMFNGELRGVRIKEEGRIGAEKIFNFIKRFDHGEMYTALEKGIKIIKKRTRYIKAINIIISDKQKIYAASHFNEDPEYFTMHYQNSDKMLIVCSEKYPYENNWKNIKNNTIEVFEK